MGLKKLQSADAACKALETVELDVCYVASHGFAARMLLQTSLLGQLTSSATSVALVVTDNCDPAITDQCSEQGVHLFELNLEPSLLEKAHWQNRRYLLEDIRSNPCLWEKHKLRMDRSKSTPLKWLQPRFGLLIHDFRRFLPGIEYLTKAFETKFLFRSTQVRNLLRRLNPKVVVATYPVMPPEPHFLLEAKTLGIPTILHLLSWDNITAKGRFPATADQYLSWGPIMSQELREYYEVHKDAIHEVGVPHFDLHFRHCHLNCRSDSDLLKSLELDPIKPHAFFAMSAPRFAPREIEIVSWLAQAVENGKLGNDMQLVVRPHPQNVEGFMADETWVRRLSALRSARVAVDYPKLSSSRIPWSMQKDDMERLSKLLASASIIYNSGSTVSIDGLAVDRPVVITAFDGDDQLPYWQSARRLVDYTHLKKFIGLAGVSVVRSYEELLKVSCQQIECPDKASHNRLYAFDQECGPRDGNATRRAAKTILSILAETKKNL